ncbi:right-handed parallel beta-helix repeat-containing protein [Jeotgalibacillus marinus]|uniref:Right-handed parallel beta-helix repeat-containing protein n=1 Tax=Jeotgalibacillus marinus TaxID=86667 RepID=A0ABV3Q1I7_9BACL
MTVFTVNPGASIQDAINGAEACDTIRIEAGTFAGFVVANTVQEPEPIPRLRIIGAGIGKTIIDGKVTPVTTNGILIPSGADQTTIECLTIQNFSDGDGLFINSNANIIHQVESKDNGANITTGDGFEIDGDRNLVLKCVGSDNEDEGFEINGNNNYIIACKAFGNDNEGFESDDGTHTLYFKCLAEGNGSEGFDIGGFDLLLCNKAVDNEEDGIGLDGEGVLVFENTVCKNGGIGIEAIADSVIYGNGIFGNSDAGVELDPDDNGTNVVNNHVIRNKTDGIRLESDPPTRSLFPRLRNKLNLINRGTGASNNLIDNNIVKENESDGILLQADTTGNCVRSNCAFNNIGNDIQANAPADMTNTFDENKCENSDPDNLCEDCYEVMTVITVKDGESIQEAINGAEACDTIRVEAGTFGGVVVADLTDPMNPIAIPRLRIIGAGIGKTVIDGTVTPFTIDGISIPSESDQTTIECLTVQNFSEGDGLLIESKANIIRHVESKVNGDDGFDINGERNLVIKCVASGNQDHGVDADGGNNNYIIACQAIDNVNNGFESDGGTHTLYFNCLAKGNEGEGFDTGDFDVLLCNQAIENGADGMDLDDGDGVFVFDNVCCENGAEGIDVRSDDIVVYGNHVCGNGGAGIEIDSNDNRNNVVRNFVKGNKEDGIQLESDPEIEIGSSNNLIDNNTVKENGEENDGTGILLTNFTQGNCVRSNCAFDNVGNDIQADGDAADNNTFDENKCGNSDPDGLCEDC